MRYMDEDEETAVVEIEEEETEEGIPDIPTEDEESEEGDAEEVAAPKVKKKKKKVAVEDGGGVIKKKKLKPAVGSEDPPAQEGKVAKKKKKKLRLSGGSAEPVPDRQTARGTQLKHPAKAARGVDKTRYKESPLARLIIKSREAKELAQTALAEKIGVSRTTIALIEQGRQGASEETCKALGKALGIKAEKVLAAAQGTRGKIPNRKIAKPKAEKAKGKAKAKAKVSVTPKKKVKK